MNKKIHIILAGGKASRFGALSKGVTKTVMPLGNTTLLYRQISQSTLTLNCPIFIATNKLLSKQITRSLSHYPKVKILYKTYDAKGPLSDLNNILKNIKDSTTVILTLGDIYFRKNPFGKLNKDVKNDNIFLAGAKAFDLRDLTLGGIVFVKSGSVSSVVKKPIPQNKSGYKWSGTAVFNSSIKKDLQDFLNQNSKYEIEDFFDYCLNKNYKTGFVEIPDFINVNTIEDFHIATLYNLAELYKKTRKGIFTTIADELRHELLKKQSKSA